MTVRRELHPLVPVLLALSTVTAGCVGVLDPGGNAERADADREAGPEPLDLPAPAPGSVPLVDMSGPPYIAGSLGGSSEGYVVQLARKPTLIPRGTEALHIWANHSVPVRDVDVGWKLATEDEITWRETPEGQRTTVELGPDENEADGPAWEFYARISTVNGTVPSPVYDGAFLDSSLQVVIQAVGSYPDWNRDEPLQASNWTRYRKAVGAGVPADPPAVAAGGSAGEDAVVAVVDTGINPYHQAFQVPGREAPGTAPVAAVDATTGQPAVRFPADPSQIHQRWPTVALENHTLYRLTGTRTYFYSTLDPVPAFDYFGHGTWTAGTVLDQAPNATIVSVQASGATLAEGIRWAAKQPWIDVVSVSWGCTANCIPFYPAYEAGLGADWMGELVDATRLAWSNGKVVVASAGNSPTPSLTDPIDSPPWVVSVGGADPARKGEAWAASKTPDVVSDFVVDAPDQDSRNGTDTVPGTSFAAPTVSGTLAGALLDLREATGGTNGVDGGALVAADGTTVTNHDLRRALNRTAVYWGTTDYDPTATQPGTGPRTLFAGVPINPAAPWLQMGWGYVNGTLSDDIATGLLQGDLPEKSRAAKAYMKGRQGVAERAWG